MEMKTIISRYLPIVLTLVFLLGGTILFSGQTKLLAGTKPNNLGMATGQLLACPATPNCVNSQSLDAEHKITPLTYTSSAEDAFNTLKTVVQSFKQSAIAPARSQSFAQETGNYIYAEFTIPVVGFVDDVEFLLDKDAQVIHVRSASRLGESDLGVNRKRIETIRAKFNQLQTEVKA
ncbi:DUF1499 domain-containing protein [Chlorogloea sp. CCALA 695]|nr:DUF1499 domain-containing protein [Chlorogloea sp. CCALA 695]